MPKLLNEPKTKRATLNTEEDVQNFLEENDIPLGANWNQLCIEVTRLAAVQDFEAVHLSIKLNLLPPTLRSNPCVWAQQLSDRICYPYVETYKKYRGEHIEFYAGIYEFEPNFYRQVLNRLKEHGIAAFKIEDVPSYYRKNPYYIITKLKKEGNIKPWVAVANDKQLVYKINL